MNRRTQAFHQALRQALGAIDPAAVHMRLRYSKDLRHPDQRERFNAITLPKLIARGAQG